MSWCLIVWQLSIPNANGHAYSYPLPTLWRWGLNLDINDIERVHTSQCSRKLWFRHYYQWIFLQVALLLWVLEVHINGMTGITIQFTESKIKKSWFDTNVGLLLYLHVNPFQPSPISLLSVHLNGIRNVGIYFNVPKTMNFILISAVYGYF